MHPAYSVTGEYLPYRAPSVDYHAPSTADDGSWLCSDGPYLEYIRSRCEFQPTLRLPDIRNRSVPLRARLAKVTLLQYQDGSLLSRMDFRLPDDLDRLTRHLSVVNDFIRQEADRRPIQNIYLVEGLNPDVVSALGQGLRVDPAFFADHERTSTYLRLPYEPSLAPRLPSLMDHEQTFSLNYYDIRAPSHKFESFSVGCADSGRDVQISRLNDKWEHPVVVRRRCSVWRTKLSDDNDWAGKITTLLQPRPTLTIASHHSLRPAVPMGTRLASRLRRHSLGDLNDQGNEHTVSRRLCRRCALAVFRRIDPISMSRPREHER
jgi:hypothetical protein